MKESFYTYISTRADYDPAKTIFLCAPSECAGTREKAMNFAKQSGWQTLAEYDGAILVVPVVPDGWQAADASLPKKLYNELCGDCLTQNGKSLFGRNGKLWCWETLIYIVGYNDGARFAGECMVAEPNLFAAAALVDGTPEHFADGEKVSDHWLVRNVSEDYQTRNCEIPVCLWILGAQEAVAKKTIDYYTQVNAMDESEDVVLEEIPAVRYFCAEDAAKQIFVSENDHPFGLPLAQAILNGLFDRVIRWKNGPDGTLTVHSPRTEMYHSAKFTWEVVSVDELNYPCAVHLPEGMKKEDAAGLPVVFSVHGRGEPAWLFAEKNGWNKLADETQAFILVVPDSPGNIWRLERDGEAFAKMVETICAEYKADRTRVYLTGFSNGATISREAGTAYPQYFAGISPWNGPQGIPELCTQDVFSPDFSASGYELPYFIFIGDNDPITAGININDQLVPMLKANHCPAMKNVSREYDNPAVKSDFGEKVIPADEIRTRDNYYTPDCGYKQGERFNTRVYYDSCGVAKVGYTVMKNMPHGAIMEQSRATWEFLRHFSRPVGSKHVEIVKEKN
ncbi:MAG: hypothetical protein LUF92_01950 [Clostridiales bacterium]|nr:hypothetical protein [Clostridiales bacterium]